MRANDLGLHAVVAHDFVRGESPVIQAMRWMGFRYGANGQIDFVEAAELHAPEDRAPCGIERAVLRRHPAMRLKASRRRDRASHVVGRVQATIACDGWLARP